MKKIKFLFSVMLLFIVCNVFGQYTLNWGIDDFGAFIGCENVDDDSNKELVYLDDSYSGYEQFVQIITVIDGITGDTKYTVEFYRIYNIKFLDVNNDGKYELLLDVKNSATEDYKQYLISFGSSSNSSQLISNNKIKFENYPNPFNESTTIKYNVPTSNMVTIKLFDVNGTELKTILNEHKYIGEYELNFKSENLHSGTYFYQVQIGNFKDAKKMLIIK